jgi:site-specific recombinase XerD
MMLAERGVALEVIRVLAGHIDIRTTQITSTLTEIAESSSHLIARIPHP